MPDPDDFASAPTIAAPDAFARTVLHGLEQSRTAPVAGVVQTGRDRYTLGGLIGEGGMGRVVEAHDQQFARVVAIKQLRAELRDTSARERFALEALITGNLEHSGVPTVYERGELADGTPFYAMHLVKGRTLGEIVAAATSIDERIKLIPVVIKVAQTVGYAHERGVVHRDIKPDNIVVGSYGEVAVLDWGIAKVRGVPTTAPGANDNPLASGGGGLSSRTSHGSVVGTPAYMSPEQASGQIDQIDERTDVFALGALLYHLLVGHAPYVGATAAAVVARAAKAEHDPIASAAASAPRGIREICEKAMARDPRDRYRTAAELADALEAYVANAVAGKESGAVRRFVNGTVAAGVVAMISATGMVWYTTSLRDQGNVGLSAIVVTVVGSALSITELRTRGRYVLSTLAFAFALATLLLGIATTFMDAGLVLRAALEPTILDDVPKYRELMTEGMRESVGAIATSSVMAAAQLILWAIARRAIKLAAR